MFKKFAIPFALVLTGCAQMAAGVDIVDGKGRYLQMASERGVFLQIDASSPQACQVESAKIHKKAGMERLCNTVSLEDDLPYAFSVINPVTHVEFITRLERLDACEVMQRATVQADLFGFQISACIKALSPQKKARD